MPIKRTCQGRYSQDLLECVDWMMQVRSSERPQTTEELIPVFANTGGQTRVAPILSKNDLDWSAELIRQAEQNLTLYLGPLAGIIIRQTLTKVSTVEELYLALSKHIDSTREREQFLKAVNANASITSTLNRRNHAVTMQLTTHPPAPKAQVRQINQALREKLEQQLAYYIGPLSRLLVRQAVEANYDLEQIIDILVKELPSEVDRERFRKQFTI